MTTLGVLAFIRFGLPLARALATFLVTVMQAAR